MNSTYHTAHVRDLHTVAPGTFVVATDQGARLDAAEPGQFVMLRPDWGRDPLLPRAFSILRRTGDRVEYLIKVMGRGTALLARLQPGDRISVLGPLGRPFPRPIPAPDAGVVTDVLVAGGVGLAPLLWYAEQVQRGGATRASLHFLYGARRAADLVLLEDVAATGADVILTTEDGSCPPGRGPETVVTGRVTAALERLLFSRPGSRSAPLRPETTRILACGPNPMMRAVAELAQAANVPCLVSLEGDMACGVGVCLGCPVPSVPSPRDPRPYRYCCIDGPVFDAREIVIP